MAGRFFTEQASREAFWYVSVNFGFSLKLTLTSQLGEEHTLLSNLVVLRFWLCKIPVPKLHTIPFQWNQNLWDPGISIFKTRHDSWCTIYQFSLPLKFQIFFHSFLRIGFQNQFPSPLLLPEPSLHYVEISMTCEKQSRHISVGGSPRDSKMSFSIQHHFRIKLVCGLSQESYAMKERILPLILQFSSQDNTPKT